MKEDAKEAREKAKTDSVQTGADNGISAEKTVDAVKMEPHCVDLFGDTYGNYIVEQRFVSL